MHIYKKIHSKNFWKEGGGKGQRLFGVFPEIHPFFREQASLVYIQLLQNFKLLMIRFSWMPPILYFLLSCICICIGNEFPNSAGISNSSGSTLHLLFLWCTLSSSSLAASAQINVKVARAQSTKRNLLRFCISQLSQLQLQIFTNKNMKHAPGCFHFLFPVREVME